MITLTIPGQSRSVSFPVPWSTVTLGQYARMQGKRPLQQAAILAGVEDSDIDALTASDKALLKLAMDEMGEVPQEPLEGFPGNIGLEPIGRFELAKKFIEQFQDVENEEVLVWDVAPYILAIYLWATEEQIKTGFYAGFRVDLVKRAVDLPITQCIAAIVFFSANCPGFQKLLPLSLPGSRMQTKRRRGWTGLISMASLAPLCQSAEEYHGSTTSYYGHRHRSTT